MNIYWEEHDNTGEKTNDFSLESGTLSSIVPEQKVVGGYDITGNGGGPWSIMFMMRKKPRGFHRFFTKLFLGWKWVDGDGLNKK